MKEKTIPLDEFKEIVDAYVNEYEKIIKAYKYEIEKLKEKIKQLEPKKRKGFVKDIENFSNLLAKSASFKELSKILYIYGYKKAQQELMATINKEINKESEFWGAFEESYNGIVSVLNRIERQVEK